MIITVTLKLISVQDETMGRPMPTTWQFDWQETDLGAVRPENIGERGSHDGVEPPILQAPWGVFARRSRAEVRTRHQYFCAAVFRSIEDEIGVGRLPFGKKELAVAASFDPLQVLLRHDLVGVDIGPRQRSQRTRDRVDRFHE